MSSPAPNFTRRRPRRYIEWKTLRRWDKLPERERGVAGYLLRTLREDAGLTQQQLAEKLGVTQQAVAQAEHWNSNPTLNFIRRWAKACHARVKISFSAA